MSNDEIALVISAIMVLAVLLPSADRLEDFYRGYRKVVAFPVALIVGALVLVCVVYCLFFIVKSVYLVIF